MESIFSDEDRVQLGFLRDEEVDALVSKSLLPEESRLASPLEGTIQFPFPEMILHMTPGPFYPVLSEFNDFLRLENLKLGRVPCDTLRAKLFGIYDLALQTNTISIWESREDLSPYGIFERTMLVFELASATRKFLLDHEESEKERMCKLHIRLPSSGSKKNEIQAKPVAEIKSSSEVARELLGGLDKIIPKLPHGMRVLHVEEILRADLAKKFHAKREKMRDELEHMSIASLRPFLPPGVNARRAEDARDKILAPRLTFHGTKRANVPHIVCHGFLKPGTALPGGWKNREGSGSVHQAQQGSTYGSGIYSSPDACFSLSYSGHACKATPASEYFGLKLIVCATLMGRSVKVDRSFALWQESDVLTGYDSHVANRNFEYIVFDPAQILPVYAVHMDWGEDYNEWHYIPHNPNEWTRPSRRPARQNAGVAPTMAGASQMCPGDRKKAKEAVMARASKWFPYGFGPMTKGKFVVEDVGGISDDEEEYGDYQALRIYGEGGKNKSDYWSWVKAAEAEDEAEAGETLDEYTSQRLKKQYAPKSLDWERIPLPGETNLAEEENDDLGIGGLLFEEADNQS